MRDKSENFYEDQPNQRMMFEPEEENKQPGEQELELPQIEDPAYGDEPEDREDPGEPETPFAMASSRHDFKIV